MNTSRTEQNYLVKLRYINFVNHYIMITYLFVPIWFYDVVSQRKSNATF